MFFKKHSSKKSNPIIFLFRLLLSLTMLGFLVIGLYSAYKHFSGVDPLQLSPQSFISQFSGSIPPEISTVLKKININIDKKDKNPKNEDILKSINLPGSSEKKDDVKGIRSNEIFEFALIADSHNDNIDLGRALNQIKNSYPDTKFIIGLGDYTDVGTIDELKKAKAEFDLAGIRYFATPGDHDLWDSRDKGAQPSLNFTQIFGPTYQKFTYAGFKFIILFNSDNYLGMGEAQTSWLEAELEKSKDEGLKGIYVFLHSPLYHPSSDHMMGRVEPKLKNEAKNINRILKNAGVKKVFAGDAHFFSEYTEPETSLAMVVVGAVTVERNPQTPRFAIVKVFDDGETEVVDVEIRTQ